MICMQNGVINEYIYIKTNTAACGKKTSKYRDVKSILLPWTDKEYEEFQNNAALFGSIDKELWRK
jgi:hypothetical protein